MTAAAWAWLGWMILSLVTLMCVAEWLYDDYYDSEDDE